MNVNCGVCVCVRGGCQSSFQTQKMQLNGAGFHKMSPWRMASCSEVYDGDTWLWSGTPDLDIRTWYLMEMLPMPVEPKSAKSMPFHDQLSQFLYNQLPGCLIARRALNQDWSLPAQDPTSPPLLSSLGIYQEVQARFPFKTSEVIIYSFLEQSNSLALLLEKRPCSQQI